ncbi:class I SAM-dependent DNA methyltransferase [Actinoalloteichus sp. GBA129-24]|uniref:class I SAM-dependent DNA methyltransferase n=1 Tax=Actinoalloteichus sp. GBA129-24 TaxID=1612551 RepID=UPI0009506F8A|nr:class I SAM-dependent methyltransferase [Actinoalloteichus sp. GBA129-24]APU21552.1 Methyltransferase domain [Actinoalloteichus sp. GBA129-24]
MYEADLAAVYDAFYEARGKDYAAEAADIAREIRKRAPDATSLLDVACGTASHLQRFAALFDDVEGMDLSADMLAYARTKLPGVRLHQGDMRKVDLGRGFDAITSMFSSVGYLRSTAELDETMRSLAGHLTPGGVLVIEPWWFPETFLSGYVAGDVVTSGGRTIARVSHSVREGGATHMQVHFIVADAESGAEHFAASHVITLFTRQEYEQAFERAGLAVEYLPGGPSGRGLFVGVG